jgi:hypothetical protein
VRVCRSGRSARLKKRARAGSSGCGESGSSSLRVSRQGESQRTRSGCVARWAVHRFARCPGPAGSLPTGVDRK